MHMIRRDQLRLPSRNKTNKRLAVALSLSQKNNCLTKTDQLIWAWATKSERLILSKNSIKSTHQWIIIPLCSKQGKTKSLASHHARDSKIRRHYIVITNPTWNSPIMLNLYEVMREWQNMSLVTVKTSQGNYTRLCSARIPSSHRFMITSLSKKSQRWQRFRKCVMRLKRSEKVLKWLILASIVPTIIRSTTWPWAI